ncbi:hypothetical protein IQ260_00495 [Leptolyngbya cf. ectocarpi LEGE 11479]|uniref:Uncharacterized protein n=1 Tax=Leptolyngbya cf. ectocarpi LEGE 11479 TaxID=1828722 RepID=A0A928X0G8_LEPEC|nr:hypothetical protein [Leptolyngbya ectocarpi]MBE9065131.1 hypothetical protein [Leptolyngbya cf. ectocarpi LEGE 11479]
MPVPTTTSGAREMLGAAYNAPSASPASAMTASQAKQIGQLNKAAGFNQPSNFRPLARALTPSPRPLANTPTGRAAINGAASGLAKVQASAPVAGALRATAPVAKAAGRFIGPAAGGGVITAGLSLANGLADPSTSAGAAATGATGAGAGAYAGALLGSLGGPAGAVIGSIAGGAIGQWAGDRLGQSLFPQRSGPADDYDTKASPFTGGQEGGIRYRFQARGVIDGNPSNWATLTGFGPIAIRYFGNVQGGTNYEITGNGSRITGGGAGDPDVIVTAQIRNMERLDGEPDTGGNPIPVTSPVPGATPTGQPNPIEEGNPNFPGYLIPGAVGLGGAALGGALAGAGANSPTKSPSLAPSFGAGPANAPRPANSPRKTPGLGSTPRAAGSAGATGGGTVGGNTRTKPKPKCPCNKGLLGSIGNLLTGNVGQGAQLGLLGKIDATTTATNVTTAANAGQLGAIATKLQTMQAFAEKAWRNTHADKLINLLTLTTVIHNGAMISRDIGETLGYVVSNGLAVVGVKDEEGNALDINGLVGSSVSNFIKSVVGEDVYNDTRTAWQKANRVLQAGSNIIWTIRNINDATQDVLEWTAENTGKIGNALIKYGVVGDRAYPFMSERVKAQDFYRRKFSRVFDGLESAENTASSLAVVTSNVREIQEEVNELGEARTRFTDAVSDFGPEDIPGLPPENQLSSSSPENQPIATAEAAAEAASQSPDVAISTDANRGDPPDDATP